MEIFEIDKNDPDDADGAKDHIQKRQLSHTSFLKLTGMALRAADMPNKDAAHNGKNNCHYHQIPCGLGHCGLMGTMTGLLPSLIKKENDDRNQTDTGHNPKKPTYLGHLIFLLFSRLHLVNRNSQGKKNQRENGSSCDVGQDERFSGKDPHYKDGKSNLSRIEEEFSDVLPSAFVHGQDRVAGAANPAKNYFQLNYDYKSIWQRAAVLVRQTAWRDPSTTRCLDGPRRALWRAMTIFFVSASAVSAPAFAEPAPAAGAAEEAEKQVVVSRSVMGTINYLDGRYINIAYQTDKEKGVEYEIGFHLDKEVKVERVKSAANLRSGDTVRLIFDEIREEEEKLGPDGSTEKEMRIVGREARVIQFVRPAKPAMASRAEEK